MTLLYCTTEGGFSNQCGAFLGLLFREQGVVWTPTNLEELLTRTQRRTERVEITVSVFLWNTTAALFVYREES